MAAKLGFELVKRAMLKELMKKGDDGIMLTLPKNELVDLNARITMDRLIKAGIDPDSLTSSDQVINILENINNQAIKNARAISADSPEGKAITEKLFGKKGEVVSFKDKIEAMKKSGDIVGPDNLKKNDKVLTREMFKNSNLNKEPISEKFIDYTIQDINKKEPLEGMKIANKIIKREGEFKDLTEAQSQRILKETDDHIFERNVPLDPDDALPNYNETPGEFSRRNTPGSKENLLQELKIAYEKDFKKLRGDETAEELKEILKNLDIDGEPFAFGGRAGHYTGGIVDVEPSLDDIGHGSDAFMARTRLVSPGNQATTSTGLNYLLAEDNDNMRVPFSAGGGGRRAFLKLMATLGGGVAAAKSGILGLGGKEVGKQTAKEVVKSAGSGTPPPYFFKLVEKIKTLGDETIATQDKAIAKKYKDYVMEEDFAGNITIIKKGDDNLMMRDGDVYMSYKVDEVPVKGKKGSTKVEEYEEFTARPDAEGKMKDVEPGVPDEVVQEGTMFEDNMTEFGKADGGRIGLFLGGGLTAGKGLLKNMLKFMSKDGSHKKSPAEILKMMNPKQFEKLLNNPKYQGQVSSEAPEGLDKIIQDMIGKTKTERSDMVSDIISTSRNIKKVDDDILNYKLKIIEDMVSKGIDREIAEEAAENISKEVAKSAGKKSTPEITEQGLLELENIQKNLVTKDRKLQAQGGLTTMLGE